MIDLRIAVIDHVGNRGGGSRFTRALLLALKQNYQNLELTYFGNRESVIRENIDKEFHESGIKVKYLETARLLESGIVGLIKRAVVRRVKKYIPSLTNFQHIGQAQREIENVVKGFDVALLPWPYFIGCPDLECPTVGVFHDFNYKYVFGAPVFSKEQFDALDKQIPLLLEKVTPVVSSKFTGSELARFYPEFANKIKIVHLAPFSISMQSDEQAATIVNKMGITGPYIIYPTNLCSHKSVSTLIHAMYHVCKIYNEIKLILTGLDSEFLTGLAQRYGVERNTQNCNIVGLGYVTNDQMDALIQCATLVISTSLYEAGNGPGLEAWSRGVPVLMSDIPAFVEHLDVLGVRAKIFDPTNPYDVADKINGVLSDMNGAKKDAEYSKINIQRHTWKTVAENYYKIFLELASGRK